MDPASLSIFKLSNYMKRIRKRIPVFLISIIFLSALLRLTFLGQIPMSLYWDETAAGYNAYSIVTTAKDEYGNRLPLYFRSFDDNKMPVSIYLSVIPISLFGLNEFSVRFVSAVFGVLTVLFTYLFVSELFRSTKELTKYANPVGLLASLLLAISPWHIQLSRAGFEATVALGFIIAGAYYFLILFLRRVALIWFRLCSK